MKRHRFAFVVATAIVSFAARGFAQTAAWDAAAHAQVNAAHRQFVDVGLGRAAQYGQAVTLLNLQPKTSGNIEQAAALLASLHGNDDLGIAATYQLARLEQMHRTPPDPTRALALYDQLYREHPAHPLAQMGVVKAALLRLYIMGVPFAEVEATGAGLRDRGAVRDFHLALADAAGRMEQGDDNALTHLLAADAAGFAQRKAAGDVYVRIGELARLAGQRERAVAYYQKFLNEFPNDQRAFLVRERQRALEEPRP